VETAERPWIILIFSEEERIGPWMLRGFIVGLSSRKLSEGFVHLESCVHSLMLRKRRYGVCYTVPEYRTSLALRRGAGIQRPE